MMAVRRLVAAPAVASAETVLITGRESGLGLEFTKQYAAKGWTVIATHRRREMPETLAGVVAEYPKVRVETLDVTDVEQARALAAKLADVPIDVLINNAGVYNDRSGCAAGDDDCPGDWPDQSFGQMDFELLDTIMDVNIKGPLIVSRGVLPEREGQHAEEDRRDQLEQRHADRRAANPRPGATFYRMSKAALNREMQIVAASVKADGVTVVILNPGPTLTEHQEYLRGNPIMIETSFTVENMINTIDEDHDRGVRAFLAL